MGYQVRDIGYLAELDTADVDAVDALARAFWAVSAASDHNIAGSRAAVYVTLEQALLQALWHVYRLTDQQARHVRELLSEYGPDDKLTGTDPARAGIPSYVAFILLNPRHYSYTG